MVDRKPSKEIQLAMKALRMDSVVVSSNGTAIGRQVVWLMMVRMYWHPQCGTQIKIIKDMVS